MKTCNGTPFVVVGGGSFNITEIIPMDGDEPVADGTTEFSWYDYDKGGFRFLRWYDDLYNSADDEELHRSGWAEDQDNQYPPEDEADLNFTAGDWFFLAPNGDVSKPTLTVAGQLFTSDGSKPTVSLPMTPSMKIRAANPLPVETPLVGIVAMDGDEFIGDGTTELSWYDYDKGGFRFVRWYDDLYNSADDEELHRSGWAEDQDNQYPPEDEDEIVFGPGRGFFLAPNADVTDPKVAFENPFYQD